MSLLTENPENAPKTLKIFKLFFGGAGHAPRTPSGMFGPMLVTEQPLAESWLKAWLRVESDHLIGWEYETNSLRMLRKLDFPRGRDPWCWPNGMQPLGIRINRLRFGNEENYTNMWAKVFVILYVKCCTNCYSTCVVFLTKWHVVQFSARLGT